MKKITSRIVLHVAASALLLMLLQHCRPPTGNYNAENRDSIARAMNSVARSFLTVAPDSAIFFANLALASAEENTDREAHFEALSILGSANQYKGELPRSLQIFNEVLQYSLETGNDSLEASTLNLLGNVEGGMGQYDEAINYYLRALEISEKREDQKQQATLLNNLGLIYYRMDNLDEALKYHQQSKAKWIELDNVNGLASSYTNISYIYAREGKFKEALDFQNRALEIYIESQNTRRIANSYLNIGWVYMLMEDHATAAEFFERSIPISHKSGFRNIYTDGLNKLGWSYTLLKKYGPAADSLLKGLEMALGIKDLSLINELYSHLSDLYEAQGNYSEALEYHKKWVMVNDSIFREESSRRIAELQVIYETEKNQNRIRQLESESRRRELYTRFIIVLAALLLILIVLIFSRYRIKLKMLSQQKLLNEKNLEQKELEFEIERTKNERLEAEKKLHEEEYQRLSMEVEHKKSELSTSAMHMYEKNESLNRILSRLDQIEKEGDPALAPKMKELRNIIQQNLNLDEDWKQFRIHFDEVHKGFFENLSKSHPSLSNTDLRHCAYIRMNLSTKEISRLLNINPTSVQRSRVRLKKKLNLSQADDLNTFITNI